MRRTGHATLLPLIPFSAAIAITAVAPAAASTAEEFLSAPVWYLEYEVSLQSTSSGSQDLEVGTASFTTSLERVFTGAAELNLRSEGPGPIVMQLLLDTSSGAAPTVADAQKQTEKLMSVMGHTANWLVAGDALDENAADPTAGMMGQLRPARIDYKRVDTGKGLLDDAGNEFDQTVTTTIKGTGSPAGGVAVRGVLDPSTGKISGEQSFKAPGIVVVKYTLTMTPPKK